MTFTTAAGAKRLDIGDVIGDTFGVIADNLATLALADVLLVGLPGALQLMGLRMVSTNPLGGGMLTLLGGLGGLIGMLVLQGAIIQAARDDRSERHASFGDLAAVGLKNALPMLGLFILMILGIALGTMLLIVPGIILGLRWSLSAPALVIERQGVLKSMKRSAALTKGNRWSIFLLFLIIFIVLIVIEFATFALLGGAQGLAAAPMRRPTVNSAVGLVINMLAVPFNSALVAALFNALRTQKEGATTTKLAEVFA